MKAKRKIFIGVFVLFNILALSIVYNSISVPDNRIPFIPVVDISINGKELPMVREHSSITNDLLEKEIKKVFVRNVSINYADAHFSIPYHSDILKLIAWMNNFYWATPSLRYNPESYDCENYARTLTVIGDFAADVRKRKGQWLIGTIYTLQTHEWAGVPSGGYHALNIILTSEGWYVHEPQNGMIIELDKYPNKDYIYNIKFD